MALTDKQQLFIEEYFACGLNATRAAIAAGYSEKTAYSQGQRLLKNVEISTEVQSRISERAMSAGEVLDRLGQIASGDMSDFWDVSPDGLPVFNMASERVKHRLNLIKRLKVKTTTRTLGELVIDITEIDFELYSALDAQKTLAQLQSTPTGKEDDPIHVKHSADLTDEQLVAIATRSGGGTPKP